MYDKDQDHVDELMLVMVILRKLPTAYEYETRSSPTVPIFHDDYIREGITKRKWKFFMTFAIKLAGSDHRLSMSVTH